MLIEVKMNYNYLKKKLAKNDVLPLHNQNKNDHRI